jgi:hypothetical protein
MIVIYPIQYQHNAPNNRLGVEVVSSKDQTLPKPSGMYDTFVIIVSHMEGVADLNYKVYYCNTNNLHIVNTTIDCNHHSTNLETLINKFKQTEEIWLT